MIPNVTKGGRMGGLLSYLVGPGKRNEHTDPHLVAGAIERKGYRLVSAADFEEEWAS